MSDTKRDFIHAQGNTIFVTGQCHYCGGTKTKDFQEFTQCQNCGNIFFRSIRKARESYPTANIKLMM